MKQTIFTTLALFLAIVFSCFAETITIMHVNDTHSCLSEGGPRNENLEGTVGGIAKAASIIGMTKMEDPNAILLHAGDLSIGDVFYNTYFGAAELGLMVQLGFDAMTLGNHEFDLGPGTLTQAITAGFENGSFPLLCGNLEGDDESLDILKGFIKDFVIKDINGVKVGIFGLTTPATNVLSSPSPAYFSDDLMTIIPEILGTLKAEACDIIVLVSHLGLDIDKVIAQEVPYIDIIISSHDHYIMKEPLVVKNAGGTNTYIAQSGPFYKNIGKFVIEYDQEIKSVNWQNIDLDENIPAEPQTNQIIKMMQTEIEETFGIPFFSQQISYANDDFKEELSKDELAEYGEKDTPIGNLICDAFLATFDDCDIAIEPGGSTAQKLFKGPITADDIYRTISYGFNTDNYLGFRMAKFEIKGAVLAAGIEFGLSDIDLNDEFFIQCSGMKYMFDHKHDKFERLIFVEINGEPIDMERTYKIVTNEFVPMIFEALGFEIQNLEIIEGSSEFLVVMNYIAQLEDISPYTDGRITDTFIDNVNEPNKDMNFNIYPNPTNDFIQLPPDNVLSDIIRIELFDTCGNIVKHYNLSEKSLDLHGLESGTYYLRVTNGSNVITKVISVVK